MIFKYILLHLVIVVCVINVESKICTLNELTNICECPIGYKNINGSCSAKCALSCGKGTCFAPNQCKCFDGYKINLKMLRSQTVTEGSMCIPSCKNCQGECIAPNICIVTTTEIPSTTTAIPTTVSISTTTTLATIVIPTTATSTTVIPMSTATLTTTTATTVIPTTSVTLTTTITTPATPSTVTGYEDDLQAPESQKSTTQLITTMHAHDNQITTEQPVLTTNASLLGEGEALKQRGVEQQWMFALIPFLILVAAIFTLLVLRRKPIIRYFRGRTYVLPDGPPGSNRVQYSTKSKDNAEDNDTCYEELLSNDIYRQSAGVH